MITPSGASLPITQRFPGDVSTTGYERSCGTRRAMETHYLYSMPIKTNIPTDSGHFFITFTCFNWLPLIEITSGYDLVYKWFDVLKENGHSFRSKSPNY